MACRPGEEEEEDHQHPPVEEVVAAAEVEACWMMLYPNDVMIWFKRNRWVVKVKCCPDTGPNGCCRAKRRSTSWRGSCVCLMITEAFTQSTVRQERYLRSRGRSLVSSEAVV